MEGRGIVTPIRSAGDVRRLYTSADIEAIKAIIRGRDEKRFMV
jgi:DNA-binding transcriptional MerR regulator